MTDWCQLNVCISSESLYVFYYLTYLSNTGWLFIKDAILIRSTRKTMFSENVTVTCQMYNRNVNANAGFGYSGVHLGKDSSKRQMFLILISFTAFLSVSLGTF